LIIGRIVFPAIAILFRFPMKKNPRRTVFNSDGTERRAYPAGALSKVGVAPARKGADMTILNKSLMAAFVGGAMGLAIPAAAQTNVIITDPGAKGLTIVTKAPEGPVVVARDDGTKVITEQVVRRQWVVPTACNLYPKRNASGLPNVSGGVGGSIGGRMILGSTPADDVPLPGTCQPIPR